MPLEMGDTAELCMGRDSNKNCELRFTARVIGSIKRMPGLWDFSGYKPAAYMTPGVIIS